MARRPMTPQERRRVGAGPCALPRTFVDALLAPRLVVIAALVFAGSIGSAWKQAIASNHVTKITNIESSYPYWSPDGERIVFQSDRNGDSEIYVMSVDGTKLERLTHHPATDITPVWSPDGTRIAFQSNRDGNREVYVMNADGSEPRNLTNHPEEDSHPKWTAAGQIIFDSNRDGNDNLYRMDADGSNLVQLTDSPHRDTYGSLSPDGSTVLWRRRFVDPDAERGFGNSEVFRARADGSEPINLTNHLAYDGWPSWSPDGRRVAFASDRAQRRVWHVYVMNADGSGVTRQTEDDRGGGYFTKPIWSPDGTRIVCTRTKDGNVEIFVITLR